MDWFTSFPLGLLAIITLFTVISSVIAAAGPLIEVDGSLISPNPTNVTMYIYVPAKLQSNPPVLVNPHWCHGSAQAAFAGSQLATLADTYGYIMIFPNSPHTEDMCWDVSSNGTLTHNGGGDSQGIASMVKYVLNAYNADAARIFVTGVSSGAMMTNVLLGSYPDIFAAGSAWAGVAFGCFAGDGIDVWSNECATGEIIKTGAEWAAIVAAAYPGYSAGAYRPKMQVFHGTNDTTLYPQNLQEEIKEWTSVLKQSTTPLSTLADTPDLGWMTYVYGDAFTAASAAGVTHNIPVNETTILAWFDLTCSGNHCFGRPKTGGSDPVTLTTTTITTSILTSSLIRASTLTSTSTSSALSTATASNWAQCGGLGYVGPTVCKIGWKCVSVNAYYSQCLCATTICSS